MLFARQKVGLVTKSVGTLTPVALMVLLTRYGDGQLAAETAAPLSDAVATMFPPTGAALPTPAPPTPTPTAVLLRPSPETWVRFPQTEPRSAALDAVQTEDGGFLLVGSTNHTHRDGSAEDVHLMRVDSAGEMLWERNYGGDAFDRGRAIIEAADGAFHILAETKSEGAGDRDVYLIKVDPDGEVL